MRRFPAFRSLTAVAALAAAASVSGAVVASSPAAAAVTGPPAGQPFALISTVTAAANPSLQWQDLTTGATGNYADAAADPAISPDGTKAAVLTQHDGSDFSDVSILDIASGTMTTLAQTPLTDGSQTELDPAWSADGNTVYFTLESGLPNNPTDAIYSIPASGGTATALLPDNLHGAYATRSPNNEVTYIDETSSSTCAVAQIVPTAGATPTCFLQLSALPQGVTNVLVPKWSPDGKTLALGYDTATGTGVLVVPTAADGTAATPKILTAAAVSGTADAPTAVSNVSWTGDGSQLIYGVGRFSAADDTPIGAGSVRSVDVAGTHAATVQVGGNVGADAYVPVAAAAQASQFVPVTPTRIADTRTGLGHSGRLGAGGSFDLAVTGALGAAGKTITVPSNATAVALNVTAAVPSAVGNLSVYPTPTSGDAVPTVSNLNLLPGRDTANAAIVTVNGGKVRIHNATGSTDVIVDISGYFVPAGSPSALKYEPLTPSRLLDTRTPDGGGALGPGAVRTVKIAGYGGVPASASAVVLNVTGIGGNSPTYVTAYPAGGALPPTSSLNLSPNETRANLVTVPLGTGDAANAGAITLRNNLGNTQLIVDVAGYYDSTTATDSYVPLNPLRVLDTRNNTYNPIGIAPLPGAHAFSAQITGTLTTADGQVQVPSDATAAVYNLTAVLPTSLTFLTAYPTGASRPDTSTLNAPARGTVPNLAVTKVGTSGQVAIYNNLGSSHVLVDLAGYFVSGS